MARGNIFIDRRLNPKDKSRGNRQRFIRRHRSSIKKHIDEAIRGKKLSDIGTGEKIKIPQKTIREPHFIPDQSKGNTIPVLPGNKKLSRGDKIEKPQSRGGKGGKGAPDGGGEDDFVFELTREEFLDLFFEDLELPDLVKKTLRETMSFKPRRSGFRLDGPPATLDLLKTVATQKMRHIALKRPKKRDVEVIEERLRCLEEKNFLTDDERKEYEELEAALALLVRRRKRISFIDPLDVRFRRYELQPVPSTKAVMFCLMDVSGSMGQNEKDIAKRFFFLLKLFLERQYKKVTIVFIRHTHEAEEVDEQTFFYATETGGTVVSTALVEMQNIIKERFPASEWNIYGAQASDGDNFTDDSEKCLKLLEGIMPLVQYYAYIEIVDKNEMERFGTSGEGKELWRVYNALSPKFPQFVKKHVADQTQIYSIFRELFEKQQQREKIYA